MSKPVKVGFIVSTEIPDGSEVLSDGVSMLPCYTLKPGRYLIVASSEPQAVRIVGELKENESIAMAFVDGSPSFDYLNYEAYFGNLLVESIKDTSRSVVGTLGAELQTISPSEFVVRSPFLISAAKSHEAILRWSAEIDNMISDIKKSMEKTPGGRSKEAKSHTVKYLGKNSILNLARVAHLKGNSAARAKVEVLVGLIDNIVQKNAYKPLVVILILLRNLLYASDEAQYVRAEPADQG